MWKYLAALVLLLTIGVVSAEDVPVCADCYANIITQTDTQVIDEVIVGMSDYDAGDSARHPVCIGNEGLSAAIIVTPEFDSSDPTFMRAGFARIDQVMNQNIVGLGSKDTNLDDDLGVGEGAKGMVWNKAIQAAWIANQGVKENETTENGFAYALEGAYIGQTTSQFTKNVTDFDSREDTKILNLDNKLAMIVDDLETVINLTASADSATTDSQSSYGNITNDVNLTVSAKDP